MTSENDSRPRFRRILLKLSGEVLMGDGEFGIDPKMIARLAAEVNAISRMGVQLALVIGGGNLFRGAGLAEAGMERVTGDQMGMLATVMNALAMQDAIERKGGYCRVMSALKINQICEDYILRRAVRHLEKGRLVIFAAGTGNPFFTTDTAASLRASEIQADLLLKGTKVNGIYDADPVKHPEARKYDRITYDMALEHKLGVMDATALVLCRDNQIPIRVFDIYQEGALRQIVLGDAIGTLVE